MIRFTTSLRNIAAIFLLASTHFSGVSLAEDNFVAPSMDERLSDLVYMNWLRNDEIGECVKCHLTPSLGELLSGEKDKFGTLSRRSEMERWLTQDKHTIARRRIEPFLASETRSQLTNMLRKTADLRSNVIRDLIEAGMDIKVGELTINEFPEQWVGMSNVLSRRMCDKLFGEGAVKSAEGYAKFRDNCLTCHGGYQPGDKGFDIVDLQDGGQLGIDCNYCHQEGNNKKWVDDHDKPERWRLKTPEAKTADGMRDLVNTNNQANMCADCHIGNRNKGMFVDHEMYAAGHPPLPSFEAETFCDEMPQHWQTPKQLYTSLERYSDRDKYFQINYPGLTDKLPVEDTYWSTRKMLLGAIQSRIASLQIYKDMASEDQWADYAMYDCASCHHELQSQSFRQRRGFHAAPGRPRSHEWFDVLLETSLVFGDSSNAIVVGELEAKLQIELSEAPFGRADFVVPIATQMIDELQRIADTAERRPINEAVAMRVLKKLASTPASKLITYDAARQLAWAIQTVAKELTLNQGGLSVEAMQVINELKDEKLTGIELSIPSGRSQYIYRESLEEDLKRRRDFNLVKFATKLRRLVAEMP